MTPELAQLLDGPVAARFGRVEHDGYPLHLCDGRAGSPPHPRPRIEFGRNNPGGAWGAPYPHNVIEDQTAAALWLAHLLAVCGERGWLVAFLPPNLSHSLVVEIAIRRPIGNQVLAAANGPTQLQALACAMLAVPETKG